MKSMGELQPAVDEQGYPVLYVKDAVYIGHMIGAGVLQLGDQRLFEGTRLPGPDDDVPGLVKRLQATASIVSRVKNSRPISVAAGECDGPRLDVFLGGVDPKRPAETDYAAMRPFIGFKILDQSTEIQVQADACLAARPFGLIVAVPEQIEYEATDIHGDTFRATASGNAANLLIHTHAHNTATGLMVRHPGLQAVDHVPWANIQEWWSVNGDNPSAWPQQYTPQQVEAITTGQRALLNNPQLIDLRDQATAAAQAGVSLLL